MDSFDDQIVQLFDEMMFYSFIHGSVLKDVGEWLEVTTVEYQQTEEESRQEPCGVKYQPGP